MELLSLTVANFYKTFTFWKCIFNKLYAILGTSCGLDELMKATVSSISLSECNKAYNLENQINIQQICTEEAHPKNGHSFGYEGSPVQIVNPSGVSTIIGISSWGGSDSAKPRVATRVGPYAKWIVSHVWP